MTFTNLSPLHIALVTTTLAIAACDAGSPQPEPPRPSNPAEQQAASDTQQVVVEEEEAPADSSGHLASEEPQEPAEVTPELRRLAANAAEKRPPRLSRTKGKGTEKSKAQSAGLGDILGAQQHIGSSMDNAMGGEGGSLAVGLGSGGMGLRGTGKGGGGIGVGSIGGLGRVDTGGGRGRGGRIAAKKMKVARSSGVLAMRGAPSQPVLDAFRAEPSGSESYNDHGVNEMTETTKDRFSTFSIDVDTGSYTIARRKLTSGIKPPAASVRVEEFVNYFSYNYPEPDAGAFGVNLEAAPSPFSAEKDRFIVRVGVQGRHIPASKRKPVHLTFLVDVSGSMNRPDKLGLAKESLKVLTNNLKPGDTVALATYAGSTGVKLEPTSVEEKGRILSAIDGLTSGGGTAMNSGMEAAYKLAMNSHKTGHVNRVIVLSDGDANIGPSSHEEILKSIRSYVDEGVTMSTIGFGMGNYKDSLMEQLANKGNGNYYYIDTIKEARKVFGEQLDGTLEVIAKDVKLQVEFNPKAVSKYRLIGYENRDIADKDFRNDKVDAGEIGAGHSVTALYEVVMDPNFDGSLAYVRIRAKKPDGYKADEQIFMLTPSDVATKLADASKDFQFATAVAGFAEILRGSPYAKDLSFDLVSEVASAAASSNQKDRQEFIALVRKAKTLAKM